MHVLIFFLSILYFGFRLFAVHFFAWCMFMLYSLVIFLLTSLGDFSSLCECLERRRLSDVDGTGGVVHKA